MFELGFAPQRIDLRTALDGLDFETAWSGCVTVEVDGRTVPVLRRRDLIRNERALARPQDLADVARLEAQDPS